MATMTVLKLDDNNRPIPDSYARFPLNASATVAIPAEDSGSATINIPFGERWFIKALTVTKESDTTVTEIAFDGRDIGVTDSITDTVTTYGSVLTADQAITITGDNADIDNAEDLKIAVFGYKIA